MRLSSTSSTTSGEGRRPCHQVVAMDVANITTRPVSFAAPGYGEGQSAIATTPQQRLRPSGGYASEEPGTVATAVRRMVAASKGGGRPCRRSRPLWRGFFIANTQHKQSVVQSVAVHAVLGGGGPGDGLSTAPSRMVTATAAYSCDRTVAALLLRLGGG